MVQIYVHLCGLWRAKKQINDGEEVTYVCVCVSENAAPQLNIFMFVSYKRYKKHRIKTGPCIFFSSIWFRSILDMDMHTHEKK